MKIGKIIKSVLYSVLLAFVSTIIITYIQGIPFYNYYEQHYTDTFHEGPWSSKYPTGIPTGYIDQGGDKNKYFNNNKQTYIRIFIVSFNIYLVFLLFYFKYENNFYLDHKKIDKYK